ncbi:hypothetical protein GW17_00045037, partial [Ensete ventricosum]
LPEARRCDPAKATTAKATQRIKCTITPTETLSSTIPAADFPSRTPRFHPSDRAPTPHRDDHGRASAHGPEPAVLAQQTRRRNASTRESPHCNG